MKHYNKEINLPMAYDDEENDMDAIENNNTININSNHFESDIDTIEDDNHALDGEINLLKSNVEAESKVSKTKSEIYNLIEKAQKGDIKSQNKIVEENIGLVWSVVQRFRNRGYEKDDLFQIGSIGLIKAIRHFDVTMNVKFSTYAIPMIMGEIKRFMRDDGMIKVSRSLKELNNKIKLEQEYMNKQLGRQPTVNELAEKLSVEKEDVVMAIESCYQPESLFSTVSDSENTPIYLLDKLKGNEQLDESSIIDKIDLGCSMKGLQERQKKILILRYVKERTQMEVAKELGISQVQVSRLEKKLLKDIRDKMDINVET